VGSVKLYPLFVTQTADGARASARFNLNLDGDVKALWTRRLATAVQKNLPAFRNHTFLDWVRKILFVAGRRAGLQFHFNKPLTTAATDGPQAVLCLATTWNFLSTP
jgi:hypothetical protein